MPPADCVNYTGPTPQGVKLRTTCYPTVITQKPQHIRERMCSTTTPLRRGYRRPGHDEATGAISEFHRSGPPMKREEDGCQTADVHGAFRPKRHFRHGTERKRRAGRGRSHHAGSHSRGGDALKPGRRATHNTRRERRQVRIQDGNSCIRDAGEKSKVATSLGVHPTPPR